MNTHLDCEDIEMEKEPGAEEKGQDDHQEFENEGEERMGVSSYNEEHEEGSNEENPERLRSPIK